MLWLPNDWLFTFTNIYFVVYSITAGVFMLILKCFIFSTVALGILFIHRLITCHSIDVTIV